MTAPPEPPPPPPPQAIFALFELLKLIGLVLALGIAQAWQNTFGALFKWMASLLDFSVFGHHPLRALANQLDHAASRVQNFFGHLALAREAGFVTFLTWQGRVSKSGADEQAATAQEAAATLAYQQQVFTPWFVGTKTQPIAKTARTATTTAKTASKSAAKARTETKTVAVSATHTATVVAKAHVATLPQTIAHINNRVGTLERLERGAAKDLSRLKSLAKPLAFAGLVAAALTRLGLSWLRCPSLSRLGRKIGCGGFQALEELFGTAFEVLAVTDLCRFALGAQALAKLIAPQLGPVLLLQNAVCLGGGTSLPSAADKTRVLTKITLPSAID